MITPITDPRRLLRPFIVWHSLQAIGLPAPPPRCYVRGCGSADYGPVTHPNFGPVQTCATHDPRPLDARAPVPVPEPPPARQAAAGDDDDGGNVPRVPIPPRPPAPDGIPLPRPAPATPPRRDPLTVSRQEAGALW